LVKGKTDVIAVVTNFFSTYFELSVLRGIELAMGECEKHYNLNMFSTWSRTDSREDEVLLEILYGKRADAVILLSETPSPKTVKAFQDKNVPLILVENYHDELLCVKSDNIQGAKDAINYLINTGKKRIGIIVEAQNRDFIPGLSQVERLLGYKSVLKERGIEYDPNLVFEIEEFRMSNGRYLAHKIVEENLDVDAVFCAVGDKIALGLIDELKQLGKRVPEDYAVVGFDDIDIANLVSPALTTVKQDLHELGSLSYKMAVQAINNEEISEKHVQLSTKLIKRGTA